MKWLKFIVPLFFLPAFTNVYCQLELERKNETFFLITEREKKELLSFPSKNFVTVKKEGKKTVHFNHSAITTFGEIEHHWILTGQLYASKKDSIGFVMGFHKLKEENTVIFSVAFSDTTVRNIRLKFYYTDTTGKREQIFVSSENDMRGKQNVGSDCSENRKPIVALQNFFYTNNQKSIAITRSLCTNFLFTNNKYWFIETNKAVIKGRLFYNMPLNEMQSKAEKFWQ